MHIKLIFPAFLILGMFNVAYADSTPLKHTIQNILRKDRAAYKIGAIAASFELPNSNEIQSVYDGTTQQQGGNPIGSNNLFQVGSITKSFIAATILQLEAEGRLKITDSIEKYLPKYKNWQHITIKQLMNHTSGIYDYTNLPIFDHVSTNNYDNTQWTPEKIVATVYRHKPYFLPGEGFHYSNTNYILLGMIIREVTRESIPYELEKRFLKSSTLALNNSFYLLNHYPANIKNRIVDGYFENKNKTNVNMSWAGSAGALVSNSIDLVRWIKDLFTGQVLPQKQQHEMEAVVSTTDGKPLSKNSPLFGYGLGIKRLYLNHVGLIWFHPGATTGYTAIMIWAPREHLALAITTNAGNLGRNNIKQIAFGILDVLSQHTHVTRRGPSTLFH